MDQFPLEERPLVSKYAATPDLTSRANAAASRLGKATVVASISDIGVAHTGEINRILPTVPSREIGANWLVAPFPFPTTSFAPRDLKNEPWVQSWKTIKMRTRNPPASSASGTVSQP